jgi:glycosyltransferase involved in cell wall biosynthesis
MKIAVISNQARSMLNFRGPLLAELHRQGHEVLAFAPDFDSEMRSALVALGARPIDFAMSRSGVNPLRELAVIFELRSLLRRHQPDICFSFFLKPVIYGTIAAWSVGVKRRYGLIEGLGFAFTPAADFDARRWIVQRFLMLMARFAFKRLNRIIFLNPDDRNEFQERDLVMNSQTALLGAIGLDLEEWSVAPLPPGPAVFILVARLLRDKGIREYVDAARIVRSDYPDARFLLVGGLDENPAAIPQAEVEAWVAEGIIEWPGHVPVQPWIAKASIFVLPSYREGFPRSTQEAMALGRAVITTDVPGCRETVIEGRNGLLVPVRDPEALARAMKHFIENPQDIAAMGNESRKLAAEQFDVVIQNRRLMGFMDLYPGTDAPD